MCCATRASCRASASNWATRTKWGDETDPRIVGHEVTAGNEEGGLKAMETLLAKDPDINMVYTINEPSAAGAYEALKAVGAKATC
jgi:fructose transport system substrate-binding protein